MKWTPAFIVHSDFFLSLLATVLEMGCRLRRELISPDICGKPSQSTVSAVVLAKEKQDRSRDALVGIRQVYTGFEGHAGHPLTIKRQFHTEQLGVYP